MTSLDKSHHLRTQMVPGSVTTVQNKIRAKRPFQLMAQKTTSVAMPLHSIAESAADTTPSDHCQETSSKAAETTVTSTARRSVLLSTKMELHQLPALLRAQRLVEAEQQGEINIETDALLSSVMNTVTSKPSLKLNGSHPGILHKRRSQSVSAVMNAHTSQLNITSRDAPPQAHDPVNLEADAACFEHAFSSYAEWAKITFAGQVSDADPHRIVPRKESILASSRQRLQREQQQSRKLQNSSLSTMNKLYSEHSYSSSHPSSSPLALASSLSSSSSSSATTTISFHRRRCPSLSAPSPVPLDNLQPTMAQSSVQSSTKPNQLVKPSPLRAVCLPRSPSSSRLRSSSVANPTIHFCLLRIVLSARDYVTIRVPVDISLCNLTHMVINKCLRCGRHRDDLKYRLFIWERSCPDLTLGVVNDSVLREVLLPKPSSTLASEKYTHAEKPVILYWT
jgi:hypothetical protein